MLITKSVKVKWINPNKKHYESKGYVFTNIFDEFEVKVEDLKTNSSYEVECICDYCLEEGINTIVKMTYHHYNKIHNNQIIKKDCCKKCLGKKNTESNLINYGVENVMQIQSIKENMSKCQLNDYSFIKSEFEKRQYILLSDNCDGDKYS